MNINLFNLYVISLGEIEIRHVKIKDEGFPGGIVVNNPPINAGDMGSSPALGRSHMPRSN